jgi:FkbM family methyltransferase
MTVLQRLDQMDAKLSARAPAPEPRPAAPRPPAGPEGATLVELNGDRLWLPDDLVKYVCHTKVSADDDPIPKFLAETEHYLWVRDHLQVGDTALDIGSNIGLFAVMMARKVKYGLAGHVHALEPSPGVFRDLQRVIAASGLDNVILTQAAMSDRCGRAVFMDIQSDNVSREASHLNMAGRDEVTAGSAKSEVEVETVTVDHYVKYHRMAPRLLKIDVEGAEFLVLEGAREFIREHHPYLVIEIHPDATGVFDHDRLRKYLDEYGYRYTNRHKIYYCE